MVDLVTLRALAEAANQPEPPRQRPPDMSVAAWHHERKQWYGHLAMYEQAIRNLGPSGVLALLAVAEAFEALHVALAALTGGGHDGC